MLLLELEERSFNHTHCSKSSVVYWREERSRSSCFEELIANERTRQSEVVRELRMKEKVLHEYSESKSNWESGISALYQYCCFTWEHGQDERAIGSWNNNLRKIIRANWEQTRRFVLFEGLDDDRREAALFLGQGHSSKQGAERRIHGLERSLVSEVFGKQFS